MKTSLRSLVAAALAAVFSACASAQTTPPAAGPGTAPEAAKPAPTSSPADGKPQEKAARPNTIDPKAKAIYDAAAASAKKIKSFDGVTQVKMELPAGEPAPPGFGMPARFVVVFGSDQDASPVKSFRLESLKEGKPTRIITNENSATTVVDLEAKSVQELGPDMSAVAEELMQHFPRWIFELKAGAEEEEDAPKLASVTLEPEETVDGTPCDVIRVVREMKIESEAEEGDAKAAAAAPQTVRFVETTAIARSDSVPRRIVESMDVVGNPAMTAPITTTTYSNVKVNSEPDAALFAAKIPEGFKKIDPPKRDGDGEEPAPALAFKKGDKAPDFKLASTAGADVSLDSLKGKVVLLDFWATWCGPCKSVMPTIQKLSEEFKDRGVVVYGVNTWEKKEGAAKKYMADKMYTYGCLLDGDTLAKTYGVSGIPTLVLINKDGTIALTEVGTSPNTETELRSAITAAIAK